MKSSSSAPKNPSRSSLSSVAITANTVCEKEHYITLQKALHSSFRSHLIDRWDAALDEAAHDMVALVTGLMSGAAETETGPAWWDGTVIEHQRVSREISVVRLHLDRPMGYHPGQFVNVQVPQCPRRWRYLSPAIPADPDGNVEFHVRAVLGGMVSTAIVGETRPGDRWRMSAPHGAMEVDRGGDDVLMVAGSTGLAPLRALIMDLTRSHEPAGPPVLRRALPLRALRPAHAVAARGPQPVAVGDPGDGVSTATRRGRPTIPTSSRRAGLHVRQTGTAARRGDEVRRLG